MGIKVYTRRDFLKSAGLGLAAVTISQTIRISDVLAAVSATVTPILPKLPSPIEGVVSVGSKPRAGIAVSDGLDIVLTDAKGRFSLANAKGDAPFVFVIQPKRRREGFEGVLPDGISAPGRPKADRFRPGTCGGESITEQSAVRSNYGYSHDG